MTDLPELQHLLIEAAGRRSRRRRRVRGVRAVALVAAAALAVVAVPRVASDDVEIPAVPPGPSVTAPATIKEAYGAFRRPAGPADKVMLFGRVRGSDTRLLAKTAKTRLFLAVKGDQACVVVMPIDRPAAGQSCAPTRDYLAGYGFHGMIGRPPTPSAFVFPDGVREVTVTLETGERHEYPVTANGLILDALPAQPADARWVAPDGSVQRAEFKPGEFEDLFSALRALARSEGELPGLPGSRRVAQSGATGVWLVPRKGAFCVVVQIKDRQASGCSESRLHLITGPLVVALPGGARGRVVVAVFSDRITHFDVPTRAGIDQLTTSGGVLLWSDAGERRTLTFGGDSGGKRQLNVPARTGGFVLGGVAKDPKSFPDP